MLIRKKIEGFARTYASKGSLWFPDQDVVVDKHRNVLGVLNAGTNRSQIIPASNIVTNDGDIYYAEQGAQEATLTEDFGDAGNRLELCTDRETASTPAKADTRANYDGNYIANTRKALTASYPMVSDTDTDNTGSGADIVTWAYAYTKTDFNATGIQHGIIHGGGTTPATNEKILTGFAFAASFDKTADDTLKVFVNHTLNGV